MRIKYILLTLIALCFVSSAEAQGVNKDDSVFYVKVEGNGDGSSWESALGPDAFYELLTSASKSSLTFYMEEGLYDFYKLANKTFDPNDGDFYDVIPSVTIYGGYKLTNGTYKESATGLTEFGSSFILDFDEHTKAQKSFLTFENGLNASRCAFKNLFVSVENGDVNISRCNFYKSKDIEKLYGVFLHTGTSGNVSVTSSNFYFENRNSANVCAGALSVSGAYNLKVSGCTFHSILSSSTLFNTSIEGNIIEYSNNTIFECSVKNWLFSIVRGNAFFYNNTFLNNEAKTLVYGNGLSFVGNIIFDSSISKINCESVDYKNNLVSELYETKFSGERIIRDEDVHKLFDFESQEGKSRLVINNVDNLHTINLIDDKLVDGSSIRVDKDDIEVDYDQRGYKRLSKTCIGSLEKDIEYYVKVSGKGDGSSWETAMSDSMFLSLLPNARSGSVFHVAEGTYIHNGNKDSYVINSDVKIIGGYPDSAKTGCISKPELFHSVFETISLSKYSRPAFFRMSKDINVELHNIDILHAGILSDAHKLVLDSCNFYEGWFNLKGTMDSLEVRNSYFSKMFENAFLTTGEYHISCITGYIYIDKCTFEGSDVTADRMAIEIKGIKDKSYIRNNTFYNVKYTNYYNIYIDGSEPISFVNNTIVGNFDKDGLIDDAKVFYFKDAIFEGNIFAGTDKYYIEGSTLENRNNIVGFESKSASNKTMSSDDIAYIFETTYTKNGFIPKLSYNGGYTPTVKLIRDNLIDGTTIRFPLEETIVESDQRGVVRNDLTCPGSYEKDPSEETKIEYFVKVDGNGDGKSWETAMSDSLFLNMLPKALKGTTFHVAEGKYLQDNGQSHQINADVNIFGGYPDSARIGCVSNPEKYHTVFESGSNQLRFCFFQINKSASVELHNIDFVHTGLDLDANKLIVDSCCFYNGYHCINGQSESLELRNTYFSKSVGYELLTTEGNYIVSGGFNNYIIDRCTFEGPDENIKFLHTFYLTNAEKSYVKNCTFYNCSTSNVTYQIYVKGSDTVHFINNTFLGKNGLVCNSKLIDSNNIAFVGNIFACTDSACIEGKTKVNKDNLVPFVSKGEGNKTLTNDDIAYIFETTYTKNGFIPKLSYNGGYTPTVKLIRDNLLDGTPIRFPLEETIVESDQRGVVRNDLTCPGSYEKDPSEETKIEYFVKVDGNGDGSSWENAMDSTTFYSMLPNALKGSVFHVAEGTYIHDGGNKPYGVNTDVTIIGGYPESAKTGSVSNPEKFHTVFETKAGLDGFAESKMAFLEVANDVNLDIHNVYFLHSGINCYGHKLVVDSCTFTEGYHCIEGGMDSLVVRNSYFAKMMVGGPKSPNGNYHIACQYSGFLNVDKCTFEGSYSSEQQMINMLFVRNKSYIQNCTFYNIASGGEFNQLMLFGADTTYFINNTIFGNNSPNGLNESEQTLGFRNVVFVGNIFLGTDSIDVENNTVENKYNLVGFASEGKGNKKITIDDIANIFEGTYVNGVFSPTLSKDNGGYAPTVKLIRENLLDGTSIRFPLEETSVITDQRGVARYDSTCPGSYEKDPNEDVVLEYFVKESGSGDGKTWETAMGASSFLSILPKAYNGTTFHVAEGNYTKDGENDPFSINTDITIIGGYPDSARTGCASMPEKFHTVLETKISSKGIDQSNLYYLNIAQGTSVEIHNIDFYHAAIMAKNLTHKVVIDSCNFYECYRSVDGYQIDSLEVRNSYFAEMIKDGSTSSRYHIASPLGKYVNIDKCTFEGSVETGHGMISLIWMQNESYIQNCTFFNTSGTSESGQLILNGSSPIYFVNNTVLGREKDNGFINGDNILSCNKVIFVGNVFAGSDSKYIEEYSIENKYNLVGFESNGNGNRTITSQDLRLLYDSKNEDGALTLSKDESYAPILKLIGDTLSNGSSIRFPIEETIVATDQRGVARYDSTCSGSFEYTHEIVEIDKTIRDTVCGQSSYSKNGFNLDISGLESGDYKYSRSQTSSYKKINYELSLKILQPLTSLSLLAKGTDQRCYGVNNGVIEAVIKTNLPSNQVKFVVENAETNEKNIGVVNEDGVSVVNGLAPGQYNLNVIPSFEGCVTSDAVVKQDTSILIAAIESTLAIDSDYLKVKEPTCYGNPNGSLEIRVGNWSDHYVAEVHEDGVEKSAPKLTVTDGFGYLKTSGHKGQVEISVTDVCGNKDALIYKLHPLQQPAISVIDSHKKLRCSYSEDGYITYEIMGGSPENYAVEFSGKDIDSKLFDYNDTLKVEGLSQNVYTLKYYSVEDGCSDFVSISDTVTAPLPMEMIKYVSPLICNDKPSGEFSFVPKRAGSEVVFKNIKSSKNYAVEVFNSDNDALNKAFPEVQSLKITSRNQSADELSLALKNALIMNEDEPETLTAKDYPLKGLWKDAVGDSLPEAWIGFDELPGDVYYITVADTAGCMFTDSIAIAESPTYLTLTFDNVKFDAEAAACNAEERRVEINVSGGWGNYVYSIARIEDLNNMEEELDSLQNSNEQNTGTSAVVEGEEMVKDTSYEANGVGYYRSSILESGHYLITITDSKGCYLMYPDTLEISSNLTVNGVVLIDKCDPSAANQIKISVNASEGYNAVGPYTYKVSSDTLKYERVVDEPTFIADSLPSGTVSVYVTDGNNCGAYKSFAIKRDTIPVLTVRHLADYQAQCFGDSTGAVSFKVFGGKPDYKFFVLDGDTLNNDANVMVELNNEQLSDNHYSISEIVYKDELGPIALCMTNMGAGEHNLKVVDAEGCVAGMKFTTTQPEQISVTAKASSVCPDGKSLGRIYPEKVAGGTKPYMYALGSNESQIGTFSSEDHLPAEANKMQYLFVRDDNGCVGKSEQVAVTGTFDAGSLEPNCVLSTWHNIGDILVAINATDYSGLNNSAKVDSTVIELTGLPDTITYELMPKELYIYGVPDPEELDSKIVVTWYGDTLKTPSWGVPSDIASGVKTQVEYERIRDSINSRKTFAKKMLSSNEKYADTLAMLHKLEYTNCTLEMLRDSFVQLVPDAEADDYYFIRISNLKELVSGIESISFGVKMTQFISGCDIVTELNNLGVVIEGKLPYNNLLQHDILGISSTPNPVSYGGTAYVNVSLGNKVGFDYTVYDFTGKTMQESRSFSADNLEKDGESNYKASFAIDNITSPCLVTVRTNSDSASTIVLVNGSK